MSETKKANQYEFVRELLTSEDQDSRALAAELILDESSLTQKEQGKLIEDYFKTFMDREIKESQETVETLLRLNNKLPEDCRMGNIFE